MLLMLHINPPNRIGLHNQPRDSFYVTSYQYDNPQLQHRIGGVDFLDEFSTASLCYVLSVEKVDLDATFEYSPNVTRCHSIACLWSLQLYLSLP